MLAKDEILQERYRIIHQLGHGGMGAVYEAEDTRLGSSVALKEIIIELDKIPNTTKQEIFRRAFEREARLLASLHHEAFPRVTDYFSEANRQFLIMELIQGNDLGEELSKNQNPFPLENILKWADQLLDALDYLHTQNPPTFHRDIKPQNLKVTARGKIKLLDFGIAKSVDSNSSTVTSQTFVGATLNYSPIEQVLPAIAPTFREFIILKHGKKAEIVLSRNTDARCDIYAVGATIYHLLTNQIPVDSAKRCLDIWEGNLDPLPNPSAVNSNIPLEFSAWLLKSMETDRENRFSSAIEMHQALQKVISNRETRNKTSERTLFMPVNSALPHEAYRSQEQISMQARTERLITADQINSVSKDRVIAETIPAQTSPLFIPVSETNPPGTVPPVTGSGLVASYGINESELSNANLTGMPYFNEKLLEENKPVQTTPPPQLVEKIEKPSGPSIFWILPIAAIGMLTITVIGGIIWFNSAATATKPPANSSVSSPTTIPTATPVITPAISPTIMPTASPEASPTPSPTQKIIVTATPNRTPVQNPTIPRVTKTSAPRTKQDPNCVFTNSCK